MDLKMQVEQLAQETTVLQAEISELKDTITRQNNAIIKSLEQQTIMLIKYGENENKRKQDLGKIYKTVIPMFPISTMDDLDKAEDSITDNNRKEITEIAKALLHHGGFKSNLTKLFSIELIMECNVDGSHNKKKIRDYPKLMDVLFRATMKDGWSYKYFLEDLRAGFKTAKNKKFKKNWVNRRKQAEQCPQLNIEQVFIPIDGFTELPTFDHDE